MFNLQYLSQIFYFCHTFYAEFPTPGVEKNPRGRKLYPQWRKIYPGVEKSTRTEILVLLSHVGNIIAIVSKTSKTTFAAENPAKFSNLRLSGGAKRDRQGDDIDCWISFGNWFFMVTGNTLYSSNGSHATTRCISKCKLICWLGRNYECSDSSLPNRAKCQSDAKENCFCLDDMEDDLRMETYWNQPMRRLEFWSVRGSM